MLFIPCFSHYTCNQICSGVVCLFYYKIITFMVPFKHIGRLTPLMGFVNFRKIWALSQIAATDLFIKPCIGLRRVRAIYRQTTCFERLRHLRGHKLLVQIFFHHNTHSTNTSNHRFYPSLKENLTNPFSSRVTYQKENCIIQ